jgi:hypothetical protein
MKIRQERMPGCSGSLCQRTKKKKLKNGCTKEYPVVCGERDRHIIDHWFWHFCYKQKDDLGKYRTHTVSVRPEQVEAVKILIGGNVDLETVLAYLKSSK